MNPESKILRHPADNFRNDLLESGERLQNISTVAEVCVDVMPECEDRKRDRFDCLRLQELRGFAGLSRLRVKTTTKAAKTCGRDSF